MRMVAILAVAALSIGAGSAPRRMPIVAGGGGGGDAAIGIHASASTGSATSVTTASRASTTGSAIVCGGVWSATATFSSLTDSASNTWTQIGTELTTANRDSRFYYCQNCTGSATHTFTLATTASTSIVLACVELLNVLTSGVFDLGDQGEDAATPFASPAITTTAANEVLVGWTGIDDTATATIAETTGFTVQEEFDGSVGIPAALMTRIVTSTGSYNFSYTRTGTTTTNNHIAGMKD